jgi:hypothetical protein
MAPEAGNPPYPTDCRILQRGIAPRRLRSGQLRFGAVIENGHLSDSQAHQGEELVSDLAALHQSVNTALKLSFIEALLSSALRREIVIVLERGQILVGELLY